MHYSTARNASISDLVTALRYQHERKVDVVAPASKIKMVEGDLLIKEVDPVLTEDGVTQADGLYRPTVICDEGLADKFGIPLAYVRRLRADRPNLLDANVNGWLHGRRPLVGYKLPDGTQYEKRAGIPGDDRAFLIRCFRGAEGEPGIARAFLSDRYAVMDHLDALMAALDGVRDMGVEIEIDGADLTDRRMTVRVVAPQITALAEELLRGYRTPFEDINKWKEVADREGMGYGGEEPIVFAGFQISNSETGGGAFQIVPRMIVKVCKNGLVITKDAVRAVHLGGRLDEGTIKWSEETRTKQVDLIRSKTKDAVATFLDIDYLRSTIAGIEEDAAKPVKTDEVRVIAKRLQFSEAQINGVLDHFVRGGQTTRGGVMNAVTAYAQTVDNADTAFDLEAAALRALTV